MTPKYRAALFDLDDTIFDHQRERREALSAVARAVPGLATVDVLDLETAHDVHLQRTHIGLLDGRLSMQAASRAHAVGSACVAPSECVVVGDLWDIDIRGALDFGIDAIWLNRYRRASEPHPKVVEIESFMPLAAKLDLFVRDTVQLEHGRL